MRGDWALARALLAQATGLAVRGNGRIVVTGDTANSLDETGPDRVIFVAQFHADGTADPRFATDPGGTTRSFSLVAFPNSLAPDIVDHTGGAVTLEHDRIVVACGHLWRRSSAQNDYEFGVIRLQGDSVFTNGVEF